MAEEVAVLTVLRQSLTPPSTRINYNSTSPTGDGATHNCNYIACVVIGKHFCNPFQGSVQASYVLDKILLSGLQCVSYCCMDIPQQFFLQCPPISCCMFLLPCRMLEPSTPSVPVISYMMDAANGSIEYDVVQQSSSQQQMAKLSLSGPMDARCPQTSSFGLLRCLGHQHIGGQCMRLINQDSGEVLCSSCPTYGASDSRATVGEERGYLVKMSQTVFDQPKQILPGANVTIESEYDPSANHFGVMALFFVDLVDFDTSCPGPVSATTGKLKYCNTGLSVTSA